MQHNKMKMKKNKIKGSFLIAGVLITLMCFLVSAIGVGSMYSGSEMPLEMYPGEEKVVSLTLQNPDISEGISLKGEILEGSDIASLKKDTFEVQHKATDVFAEMIVKIPENANIGQKYNIRYKFQQTSGGEGEGMLSFGQSITRNFDVNIVEGQETPSGISITWIILGILAIIVVVILVKFLLKSKEETPTEKPAKK